MNKIFYFSEKQKNEYLGGTKAREDIDNILNSMEFTPIICRPCRDFSSPTRVIDSLVSLKLNWRRCNKEIGKEDYVIIQYPFGKYDINIKEITKVKNKKNTKFIAIIHDIPSIQENTIDDIEEKKLLQLFDVIVCHNKKMMDVLSIQMEISSLKMVSLEIFDYLYGHNVERRENKYDGLTIAGNLSSKKAGYIYKLKEVCKRNNIGLNLYGPNFEGEDNEFYLGSYPPAELIKVIKGSFGLIWDGDSLDTCNGTYGEYQKINNPHRVSMNLAAKIPLLIWKEAALKDFVVNNGIGVEISSLNEIKSIIDSITEKDYEVMLDNLESISKKITTGYYAKKAISEAIEKAGK